MPNVSTGDSITTKLASSPSMLKMRREPLSQPSSFISFSNIKIFGQRSQNDVLVGGYLSLSGATIHRFAVVFYPARQQNLERLGLVVEKVRDRHRMRSMCHRKNRAHTPL